MASQPDPRDLIASHHKRLVGWFCIRVGDRDTAEDLAQRTWVEVLRRVHTYSPEKGNFFTFTLIWADKVLRRHRSRISIDRSRLVQGSFLGEEDDDDFERLPAGSDATDSLAAAAAVRIDRARVFSAMLGLTLGCDRLPHEILAFGYIRLLDWKPARFVAELREATLHEIATLLYREYRDEVAEAAVDAHFRDFIARLEAPLASWKCDQRARRRYAELLDQQAGGTRLEQYFVDGTGPETSIFRWWEVVARQVAVRMVRLTDGPVAEWIADLVSTQRRDES